MNINRKKKDETPIIENKAFVDGIVVLQDRLEGASRRTRTNVIGVVNLGYETYNVLPGLLADNTSTVGLKSLIIDLDLNTLQSIVFITLKAMKESPIFYKIKR